MYIEDLNLYEKCNDHILGKPELCKGEGKH